MERAGSSHPAVPMTFAGMPATVAFWGTGLRTTDPAAILAQWPTSILPRILAPAPIRTPRRILGCRSPRSLAVPGSRVDVGLERVGGAALKIEREILPSRRPEPVGQAVGLNGVEALEVEHGLDDAGHDRVPVHHSADIGSEGRADAPI